MCAWHSYLSIRPTSASRATPYTGVLAPTIEIEAHATWCWFAPMRLSNSVASEGPKVFFWATEMGTSVSMKAGRILP